MDVFQLLLIVLFIAVVAVLGFWVIGKMGMEEPVAMIVRCIFGAIILLFIIGMFTGHVQVPKFR